MPLSQPVCNVYQIVHKKLAYVFVPFNRLQHLKERVWVTSISSRFSIMSVIILIQIMLHLPTQWILMESWMKDYENATFFLNWHSALCGLGFCIVAQGHRVDIQGMLTEALCKQLQILRVNKEWRFSCSFYARVSYVLTQITKMLLKQSTTHVLLENRNRMDHSCFQRRQGNKLNW